MSDEVIIRVENLGKKYRLGAQTGERYTALRDVIATSVSGPFRRMRNGRQRDNGRTRRQDKLTTDLGPLASEVSRASREDFWALKDVSFEVKQGEVVGIIGRNGAGKSTLLKILSRITEPTEGRVRIRGRVASLLEVGTGFHPELTGRENIFLNGAILGMHRVEIKAKFDEIVAFAEVERFLDTPVKRYSSGMYVRLAFAVAAHLDPEILIVDEVLAVGDAEFQKKCLGKMQEVSTAGRTVLFVSHNMGTTQKLCQRGILLQSGAVVRDGSVADTVSAYLSENRGLDRFDRQLQKTQEVQILTGIIYSGDLAIDPKMTVQLTIQSDRARSAAIDLRLSDATALPVAFGSLGTLQQDQLVALAQGLNTCRFSFPTTGLANGSYTISIDLTVPFQAYLDRVEQGLSFDVERAPSPGRHFRVLQGWGHGSVELPLTPQDSN